ncbi:hypothetical protein Syun_026407 [Stephania yunnanensis]|uniref:Uncharacterized protein n=1 Tax=Stephania yunnanensis TaxID=152371 RepID=A0AAP0EYV4_9MAGN
MDQLREFAKDSKHFVNKCHKPDTNDRNLEHSKLRSIRFSLWNKIRPKRLVTDGKLCHKQSIVSSFHLGEHKLVLSSIPYSKHRR